MNDDELRARLVRLLEGDAVLPPPLSADAAAGKFTGRRQLENSIAFVGGALCGVVLREHGVDIGFGTAVRIVREELTARARKAGCLP